MEKNAWWYGGKKKNVLDSWELRQHTTGHNWYHIVCVTRMYTDGKYKYVSSFLGKRITFLKEGWVNDWSPAERLAALFQRCYLNLRKRFFLVPQPHPPPAILSYSNFVLGIGHTTCNFALKLILLIQGKWKKTNNFLFGSYPEQKSALYKLSIDRSILVNGEKLLFQSKTPCYIYKQYADPSLF